MLRYGDGEPLEWHGRVGAVIYRLVAVPKDFRNSFGALYLRIRRVLAWEER